MTIQHNLSMMNISRSLGKVSKRKANTASKLSSGYFINSASDDAASLSISEKMRAQIRALDQSVRNINDGINYVQVADGALSEVQDMMHRMNELAIQSANDTNTASDRNAIDKEFQQLKAQMDQIFETTEFNTKKIWDDTGLNKVVSGERTEQALKMTSTSYQTFTITEANKGAVPRYSYTLTSAGTDKTDPDTYGFNVSWTAYNGNKYTSNLISWPNPEEGAFSVNLKDYLDTDTYPELKGINFKIGWTNVESATVEEMSKAVNGITASSHCYGSETTHNSNALSGVGVQINTNYEVELASDRNMDAYDTSFFEPELTGSTNISVMPSYTDIAEDTGWEFKFNLKNIGTVTAKSTNVSYTSADKSTAAENLWWKWSTDHKYQSTLVHYPDGSNKGTLHNVTDCITDSGNNGDSLTKNSSANGIITIGFSLEADSGSFTYGGGSYSSIGSMSIQIAVSHSDTENTIMEKLHKALNDTSIIDVYEGSSGTNTPSKVTSSVLVAAAKTSNTSIPIYSYEKKSAVDLNIQAGALPSQGINISYDCMRNDILGLSDTNVLTRDNAVKAISDISKAVDKISDQRSYFGACENRLEHAANANANTSENTQAAESAIRDADMADLMVQYAKDNILEQVGQALLANSKRNADGILRLLQ